MMDKMRWSTRKRIEFIESRLFWDGKVSRKDLTDFFDVSVPQATKDLKMYADIAPENIKYDRSAKCYVIGDNFKEAMGELNSDSYFSHLSATGINHDGIFFCGMTPPAYQLPFLARKISRSILKTILFCMREDLSVEIEYQSMSAPEPTKRWITPHALGFDGFRWHVRALCHRHKMYRDFVLSRIISVGNRKQFGFGHNNDYLWNNNLKFRIAPHPDLPPGQKKSISCEFNMTDGEVILEIKAAFHFYLKRRLRFNIENNKQEINDHHVVIVNNDEIEAKLSLLFELESSKVNELPIDLS